MQPVPVEDNQPLDVDDAVTTVSEMLIPNPNPVRSCDDTPHRFEDCSCPLSPCTRRAQKLFVTHSSGQRFEDNE